VADRLTVVEVDASLAGERLLDLGPAGVIADLSQVLVRLTDDGAVRQDDGDARPRVLAEPLGERVEAGPIAAGQGCRRGFGDDLRLSGKTVFERGELVGACQRGD